MSKAKSSITSAQSAGTAGRSRYAASLDEAWQQHLAPRAADAPTVVSTFAGCGGSSLGYSMAGYRELLAVEWDANAVQTFGMNFPDVAIYHGDICALTVDEVLSRTGLKPGELDVFDGSPPCQGFSTAGKRDLDDGRNQLFREYVRLLRGLQPRAFIMENVPGMVKGKMKLVFAECLRELRASGYRVKAAVLNAMYFGVPQSREWMIFVGVREDLGIDPSHPAAQTRPLALRDVIPGVIASRSQQINPWIPSSKCICTITKTPFDGILKTATGERQLTCEELSACASFPAGFAFNGGHMKQWARIGNSVPPLFMRAIATHLRQTVLSREATGG